MQSVEMAIGLLRATATRALVLTSSLRLLYGEHWIAHLYLELVSCLLLVFNAC